MLKRLRQGRWRSPHSSPTSPPATSTTRWREGLSDELAFWTDWFDTHGGEWPGDYERRLDPDLALQPGLRSLVDPVGRTIRILDVGAGPLTFVGKRWEDHHVDIVAVDALAGAYDRIMARAGVTPVVRTRACETERLRDLFAPEAFDLTCASNTLDHSYDPILAIRNMVAVTRPGGAVYLRHNQDEAEAQGYDGFHQWNLRVSDQHLIVWRPGASQDLAESLGEAAWIERAEVVAERRHEVVLRR